MEKSRYLIQFVRREAKTTNFNIANYGGIAAYEGRAVGEYDAIDCGPSLGVLSINAIVAADKILVPTRLSMYSLDGLNALLNTIGEVKQATPEEYDWRVLLTMVKGHGKERQASAWNILAPLADKVLKTQIRETESVEKSQMSEDEETFMAVVLQKQSGNRGAQDYRALVKELVDLWPA